MQILILIIKLNNKKKESIESNSATTTTTRNDVDDNALSPSPSPIMESMLQVPENRNQIDEHLLSKENIDAFTDGTMQKLKNKMHKHVLLCTKQQVNF